MLTPAEATQLNAALAADVARFTQAAPPPVATKYFTYFGYAAGNAAPQADHCNMVFIPEWGEISSNFDVIMQRNIGFLNEAKAVGINAAVLDVGFQCWSGTNVSPTLAQDVTAVFTALRAGGVLSMVKVLYPIDEPDIKGFSDSTIRQAVNTLRAVASNFSELNGVQFWCIYAQNGTPAMSAFDAVGWDNYGQGAAALNWYTRVPSGQGKIVVPGGANPWQNDPAPFAAYAVANANTHVVAFLWMDYAGGQGISDNGMLPQYRAAGKKVTGK